MAVFFGQLPGGCVCRVFVNRGQSPMPNAATTERGPPVRLATIHVALQDARTPKGQEANAAGSQGCKSTAPRRTAALPR